MLHLETLKSIVNEIVDKLEAQYNVEYRRPIPVAVGDTRDNMWILLKRVHPWHYHPLELLNTASCVIVIAIPLSREAIESNVRVPDRPSLEWLREYRITNIVIEQVLEYLRRYLESLGYKSVVIKPTHEFDEHMLVARWSHRHAGYVVGLGTFGLNNMLITEAGCAVRLGTLITEANVELTKRPDYEYCLAKRGYKCRACVERCPIGALERWHTTGKYVCYSWLLSVDRKYSKIIGGTVDACGKCVVGLPCTYKIPEV